MKSKGFKYKRKIKKIFLNHKFLGSKFYALQLVKYCRHEVDIEFLMLILWGRELPIYPFSKFKKKINNLKFLGFWLLNVVIKSIISCLFMWKNKKQKFLLN